MAIRMRLDQNHDAGDPTSRAASGVFGGIPLNHAPDVSCGGGSDHRCHSIASDRSLHWQSGTRLVDRRIVLNRLDHRRSCLWWLGDAFGRRRLMFVALAVFIAASLLCAASPTIEL